MNQVYLTYSEHETGGETINPRDRWSEREDIIIDFSAKDLYIESLGDLYCEPILVDFDPITRIGKPLYVVIVRYGSGDTFGHSTGNWQLIGCYKTAKEAEKIEKQINNDTYKGYCSWKGYFESLESVQIEVLKLEDNRDGK